MSDSPRFFNPFGEIQKHGAKLPHWEQTGVTYFITFRLGDSIPQSQLKSWKAERSHWISRHPEPWTESEEAEYHRRFSAEIDRLLDQGTGSCLLRKPDAAATLSGVLTHSHKKLYFMHAFVIMPNHVHLLASLDDETSLAEKVKIWKGVSANRINQIVRREGDLWQKNYFDRIIRDHGHFIRVARYIRTNPEKGMVKQGEFLLWESEQVRAMLDAQ
ncbi:MAG: transposase [Verrucomicrobiales bacterium]|jgi:putative transposase|nr:transposase [Verrucomicrobiales bacterium]